MYKAASRNYVSGKRILAHGMTQAEFIAEQMRPAPKQNDTDIERMQKARARITLKKFSWEE